MNATNHMRTFLLAALVATAAVEACRSTPAPPPPAPVPLNDSATAALSWVQAHAAPFAPDDSVASAAERAAIFSLTSGARIIGVSELNEGTHELPYAIRRALFTLADSGVRALAIQASMADAMEVDRYVRGGSGDARRLLRNLNPDGSERIATRETIALVEAMRDWNRANPNKQIGFYGFEIPTAAPAVRFITTLPDSVLGAPLKSWLIQRYSCVAMNEGAQWGREGRASDSTFWSSCGPTAVQATDSIVALRRRMGPRNASDHAFAEQMARLIQHHVTIGLRRLPRHETVAEHILFLADMLGPDGRLMTWGGDVEMGRLTLDKTTVQSAVVLGQRLGARYRNIAFTFGDGAVRARVPNPNSRSPEPPGFSNARVLPPLPNTYEDVFIRATPDAYWLDLRALPTDLGGAWLKGPRNMRFVTEVYSPLRPDATQTVVEFPANFDGVLFVKHARPATP
jgi:erythromycin esterase-like protein